MVVSTLTHRHLPTIIACRVKRTAYILTSVYICVCTQFVSYECLVCTHVFKPTLGAVSVGHPLINYKQTQPNSTGYSGTEVSCNQLQGMLVL